MHVFVLNLDKDVGRRDHINAQMNPIGLSFEFVQAIYGAKLSAEERLKHYDERKARWRESRGLTSAEIGCSLTHIKTYQLMVRRNIQIALVLEDDVQVPVFLGQLLTELEKILPSDKPLVCLLSEAVAASTILGSLLQGRFSLAPFVSGYHTSSYIVTLAAAQVLISELYPVAQAADPWDRLHRFGVVDLCTVTPAVIQQDRETFGSSTTDDIRQLFNKDWTALPLYKLRRIRNVLWDEAVVLARRFFFAKRRTPISSHDLKTLAD